MEGSGWEKGFANSDILFNEGPKLCGFAKSLNLIDKNMWFCKIMIFDCVLYKSFQLAILNLFLETWRESSSLLSKNLKTNKFEATGQ